MIEASIDSTTWITTVNIDTRTFTESVEAVMAGARYPSKTHKYSMMAFFHETIHFWQSISTNFLYEYSLESFNRYLEAIGQIMNSKKNFIGISQLFENAERMLKSSPNCEVSPKDIIEGSAVFNTYRICAINPSNDGFLQYLKENHAHQPIYFTAYHYTFLRLGEDAYELFSPICYVALQYPNPGLYFTNMVSKLQSYRFKKKGFKPKLIQKNPLALIMKLMHTSIKEHLLTNIIPSLSEYPHHPILLPYIKFIVQITKDSRENIEWAEDMFARPYYYISNGFGSLSMKLIGALFHTFGGQTTAKFIPINNFNQLKIISPIRVHVNPAVAQSLHYGKIKLGNPVTVVRAGLTQDDNDLSIEICNTTTLIGVIQAIKTTDKDSIIMLCPYKECPNYSARFCSKYYFFPENSYKECKFPVFMKQVGIDLDLN